MSFPVAAQVETGQQLIPVTVSGSRFESSIAPIGAIVITAEQIRESGSSNVNEAIRKIAGVFGRQNLSGTSDSSLDLRGFGANSDQNVAVFVDGIRISENELQPAMMSAIAIETVERIEIVRGGSSVLYGEGSTGGTIQIITKRGLANTTSGSVVAEVGNFGYQDMRASLSKGWDSFALNANLGSLRTDNYRKNSELKQDNFSGGLQWASKISRIGLRVDSLRQDARFPGSLTEAQYLQNPRQTMNPFDYGSTDSDRYTLFGEINLKDIQLAAELSRRDKKGNSFGIDSFDGKTLSDFKSNVTQFSPRVRYISKSAQYSNEFVVGVDFAESKNMRDGVYQSNGFGDFPSASETSQQSKAIYARNDLRFEKTQISFGFRHEKFDQDFRNKIDATKNYDESFSLNAFDLQGSYQISNLIKVFSKIGRSYRVANADENSYSFNNERLRPQRSNDFEFGSSIELNKTKLVAKVFRHNLKDEIFFNPTLPGSLGTGVNVNLDKTRRQGVEIDATTGLSETFSLSAFLQHVSAKLVSGPNDGNDMVLVPKNTATLRLNWLPGNGQTAYVGAQWVDSQLYGGDFTNTCGVRIPAYATLDARYSIKLGTWEFALSGSNLTDKNYFGQAFGDTNGGSCKDGIYPNAGRALKFTARINF
ncbi:TonB-dependent receptor [Oxalicibacterium faecigallinarum]|uniref:TonB-dependent receptor n=1 Tax=Oxalicibacterium faecigallinarum TaxID=573741 RepID=A0A8J3AT35_9BURK|nr:TonB-dependent receptor [Oxalicibacterium faecigallinarum]